MKNDDFDVTDTGENPKGTEKPIQKEPELFDYEPDEDISIYYPNGDVEGDLPKNSKPHAEKHKAKKKGGRLTNSQIALIAVVFVLYTAIIVAASWILFYKPTPKNSGDIPFDTNPSSENAPPIHRDDAAETSGTDFPPVGDGTTPGVGGNTEDKAVGEWVEKKEDYNILVVGVDKNARLADITMLVNVDKGNGNLAVMQIPRDTLVTTGVPTDKINAQYATLLGNAIHSGDSNPYQTALAQYARILEQSLCVKIHYTALVDLKGFPSIVDSVGPIRVFVPGPMVYDDPYQDLHIDIPEGWVDLDGETAEGFVRFRSDYVQGDLGRVNAQKIFLTAMYQKVISLLKNMEIGKITELAQVIKENTTTDMSVSDLVYFAGAVKSIGVENVTLLTIPGGMEANNVHFVINRAAARAVINRYFNIYEKEIADNIFDRKWTFCYNYDVYKDVYYAPAENALVSEYTGDEIDQGSISIPFQH